MSAKRKPTRGPDPVTGAPTYEMIEALLAGFRHTSYHDYASDPAYLEATAKAADRRHALEDDPELRKLERAAKFAERAAKVRGERLKQRAESIRNRLLSEGLTPAVLELARELVASAERSAK